MIITVMYARNVKEEPGIYIYKNLYLSNIPIMNVEIYDGFENLLFNDVKFNLPENRYEIILPGIDRADVQSYIDKNWVEFVPEEEE